MLDLLLVINLSLTFLSNTKESDVLPLLSFGPR